MQLSCVFRTADRGKFSLSSVFFISHRTAALTARPSFQINHIQSKFKMTMTMNRCKPILSSQAVNLLRSSTSTSSSSQANTSITSTRRVNTNHGGDKKNNNVWFAVGTATAASALAYKLFQDRDRSVGDDCFLFFYTF